MFEQGYTMGGVDGPDAFLDGATLEEAVTEAEGFYPKHTRVMFDGDLYTLERGGGAEVYPPNRAPSGMPRAAHRAAGLGTYDADQVMSMSIGEAHRKLLPFFKIRIKEGIHKGKTVAKYDTAASMRRSFLTANAKLMKGAKAKGIEPGYSRGLNLLPHKLAPELSRKRLKTKDLCVGSNAACRATCLVYSGNNPIADSQVNIKLARTESLSREPVAWMRMFMAAVDYHIDWCRKRGLVPYVRPNVLSDIPWELVFPDMFDLYPDLSWYDYTKVAGRNEGADNYDLTFSFSGTNMRHVDSELGRGRRVAVVFWLPRPCGPRYKKPPCDRLDELTFMGQPIIDGDHHDFRPLDPPGSVIGLTYKVPRVKGKTHARPPKEARKFVVETFRDADTGALIVPGTPMQLGAAMAQHDAAPSQLLSTR